MTDRTAEKVIIFLDVVQELHDAGLDYRFSGHVQLYYPVDVFGRNYRMFASLPSFRAFFMSYYRNIRKVDQLYFRLPEVVEYMYSRNYHYKGSIHIQSYKNLIKHHILKV